MKFKKAFDRRIFFKEKHPVKCQAVKKQRVGILAVLHRPEKSGGFRLPIRIGLVGNC